MTMYWSICQWPCAAPVLHEFRHAAGDCRVHERVSAWKLHARRADRSHIIRLHQYSYTYPICGCSVRQGRDFMAVKGLWTLRT